MSLPADLDDMKPGKIWYREPDDPLPEVLPRGLPHPVFESIKMQSKVEAIRMGLQLRDAGQPVEEIIPLILQEERELVETYTARYLIENGTPEPARDDYGASHMSAALLYGVSYVKQMADAAVATREKTVFELLASADGAPKPTGKTIKFRRWPFKNEDPS